MSTNTIFTILQISDLHIPDTDETSYDIDVKQNLLNTINTMLNHQHNLIVVTGDIAFKDANYRSYEYVKQAMQSFCKPYFILGGNHDSTSMLQSFFPNSFPNNQTNYTIENKYISIICLDSSASIITDEQILWLEHELENTNETIIFVHHPILPTNVVYMEKKYRLPERNKVLAVLEKHHYPIHIFCGHFHSADTQQHKHITQYICPSILYQIDINNQHFAIGSKQYGFRTIHIGSHGIETELVWID